MTMTQLRMFAGAVVVLLAANGAFGESVDAPDPDAGKKLLDDHASRLRMTPVSEPDDPLERREQPLISWTNSTRAGGAGGMFLWTQNRRPTAFAGIMCRLDESSIRVGLEFHSLTASPLNVEYDGRRIWSPTGAGIKYLPVAGSKPPAASAPARLRQMKEIARQFSIIISSPLSETETLRVLPTPIYRYSEPEADLIDGAIIAYSQGTDPEALLLLEATSSDGTRQWRCAIARCTIWAVQAQRNNQIVYEVPVVPRTDTDMSAAFFNVRWTTER